jgi:hypothetical protein
VAAPSRVVSAPESAYIRSAAARRASLGQCGFVVHFPRAGPGDRSVGPQHGAGIVMRPMRYSANRRLRNVLLGVAIALVAYAIYLICSLVGWIGASF